MNKHASKIKKFQTIFDIGCAFESSIQLVVSQSIFSFSQL